jgi:hypothetical protein
VAIAFTTFIALLSRSEWIQQKPTAALAWIESYARRDVPLEELCRKSMSGAPENVVRTVTENCRTLRFSSQGFEEE